MPYLCGDGDLSGFDFTTFKSNSMKKNMGGLDRIVRLIIVVAIAVLYYFEVVTGTLAYVLLALSGIFFLTSLVSFCPLYALVGLNTCKTKA